VSVVIPALNGSQTLSQQLEALAGQDYPGDWEVVLADNGSDDDTIDVARRWESKVPLVVVDASARRGISFARNAGWRAASGDLVAYTDADDAVDSGWLTALAGASPRADLLGGVYETDVLNDPVVRAWRDPLPTEHLPEAGRFLRFAVGGNLAVWAEVLQSMGGFNEDYERGATDVEFSWRAQLAGFELQFIRGAIVHHRYRQRMVDLSRQFYRYGRSDAQLYRDFRQKGMPPEGMAMGVLAWARLFVQCPQSLVTRARRGRLVRRVAYRTGRLAGSVKFGVSYL
jgi:glycosyltransferase involved in cell wall biosynthesis